MVDNDLQALEDWAIPLLTRLEPGERRKLARTVATELRRSQRTRIRRQLNPDGTSYVPRRRIRSKAGAIRRGAMFQKITRAKYLKTKTSTDSAEVGFVGRVARIARVHQYGERDRVDRDGPEVRYPERRLLGFTHADRELIRDLLLDHLNGDV